MGSELNTGAAWLIAASTKIVKTPPSCAIKYSNQYKIQPGMVLDLNTKPSSSSHFTRTMHFEKIAKSMLRVLEFFFSFNFAFIPLTALSEIDVL